MRWKNFEYERINGGVRIVKYVPEEEEDALAVPSRIGGEPVTEIGEEAFVDEGMFLSRVEIPPTVKRIGDGAFRMCVNLTELILSEGLREIGTEALFLTPLTEVALPDSVREIGCPSELGSIRFIVSPGNPCYCSDGFCLFKREGGDGRRLLVSLQDDPRESYEVPEGTTAVGENAFSGNESLVRVSLPGSVESIGEAAFEGCQNLSEIGLSEGLKEIGPNAFGHCIRLKELHIPSTVESIGESALSDTFGWSDSFQGLERITVEPGNGHVEADGFALFELGEDGRHVVKYLGEGENCRIPQDVSRILPGAFRRAEFYRCEIPETVRFVGKDAFKECRNLSEIFLEETGAVLYIPGQPLYRKDEVTSLFYAKRPEGGYIYDYAGYDALFAGWHNLPDRCGMACCRLKYPVCLSGETAKSYRDFLTGNLPGILTETARKQDTERLVMLAELGLFTDENIDGSLDILSRAGQTKFTGFLLNYRKEHGGGGEFDFSL